MNIFAHWKIARRRISAVERGEAGGGGVHGRRALLAQHRREATISSPWGRPRRRAMVPGICAAASPMQKHNDAAAASCLRDELRFGTWILDVMSAARAAGWLPGHARVSGEAALRCRHAQYSRGTGRAVLGGRTVRSHGYLWPRDIQKLTAKSIISAHKRTHLDLVAVAVPRHSMFSSTSHTSRVAMA